MSIHLISLAILVVLAVLALAFASIWFRGRRTSPAPAIATTAHAERVVVMSTAGGRLEVAAVAAREAFERPDPKVLLDLIDLATTVPEVRVDVTYRFPIEMAMAWPLRIAGRTCPLRAGRFHSARR